MLFGLASAHNVAVLHLSCHPRSQQLFPPAAIVDGEIGEVSLRQYKGQYVILFFYPKVSDVLKV